jgi:hypothetical protein
MSQKSEPHLHNVAMFTLSNTILLVSMRTRHLVGNANIMKKEIKFLILSTPIRLDRKNLAVKLSLNKALKLNEVFKNH